MKMSNTRNTVRTAYAKLRATPEWQKFIDSCAEFGDGKIDYEEFELLWLDAQRLPEYQAFKKAEMIELLGKKHEELV
jgi:hypothetical protein